MGSSHRRRNEPAQRKMRPVEAWALEPGPGSTTRRPQGELTMCETSHKVAAGGGSASHDGKYEEICKV